MSEDNYKFGLDDVGEDSEESETDLDVGDSIKDGFSFTGLAMLPLTVFAVYAFIAKSSVVTALTALFGGATMAATIVATALWVVGGVVLGSLGLVAIATLALLLAGLVQRSGAKFGLGLLGALYFGAGYAGATYLFGYVPLLVGFMLTTTLLSWGVVLVIGTLGVLGMIAVA